MLRESFPKKIISSCTYFSKAKGKALHKTVAFPIRPQEDSKDHYKRGFYNMAVITIFFTIPG